jgi:TolA-binding protein
VVQLLQNPGGELQEAIRAGQAGELVARGRVVLAEAELALTNYAAAEAALQPLEGRALKPELDWQRTYLLVRIKLGDGRLGEALENGAKLGPLAEAAGRRDLLAEGNTARGGIFEQMNDRTNAIAAYRQNLTNAPAEQQRQAVLKIARLAIAGNLLTDAEQSLETYCAQFPDSPVADLALLTLGELHLKDAVVAQTNRVETATNAAPAGTNHLQQALATFNRLINTFSNSTLVGKAQLDKGWCLWLNTNIAESIVAFSNAVAQLPPSEDRVVARATLADALFRQKDYSGALQDYRTVTNEFAEWPRLKAQLGDQVLYQIERASLELKDKDMAGATNAVEQMLKLYPASALADRSLLLLGQGYADLGEPPTARVWLERLLRSSPDSSLLPEAELAVARTFAQESDWPGAITNYEAWLEQFPTNELRPNAEFYRAWATWQSGQETNALKQFTNLVAQFPTNELAPLAQQWVANYYYNQDDYINAEKSYKVLFQTWTNSELAYEARMSAGRAALGQQNYQWAIDHFTNLTSNPNCPPELKNQAMFAYGGALMLRSAGETTNNPADLISAIRVFGEIYKQYPNTGPAARAWGEIGNCYLQLAAQDTNYYKSASDAYKEVINSSNAPIAARSQARVGLAIVAEKLARDKSGADRTALFKLAREYYLDVFYDEEADQFWRKKAGLEAARVVESEPFQEWRQATNFYGRLQALLPPLKDMLEKRIEKIRKEHPEAGQN